MNIKGLLIIVSSLFFLSSCSEEIKVVEKSGNLSPYDEKTTRVHDLSVRDSLLVTIKNLYTISEVDQNVINNVFMIFDGIQNGSLLAKIGRAHV